MIFFAIICTNHWRIYNYSKQFEIIKRKESSIANMDKCIFVRKRFLSVSFSIDLFFHFIVPFSPRFRGLFYCCLLLQFADLVYYSYWYEFVEKHERYHNIYTSKINIDISNKKKKYIIFFACYFSFFRKLHETSIILSFIYESIIHLLIFSLYIINYFY